MARLDLADLLTASGTAMGKANRRLAGAPAMLREFSLDLDMEGVVHVRAQAAGVHLQVSQPGPQMLALRQRALANLRVRATFVAAPSLEPAPSQGGDGGD